MNTWDRWYDYEKREFIQDSEFQPEENLTHAMRIVDCLEEFGYRYSINGPTEVRFNDISEQNNHFRKRLQTPITTSLNTT